MDGSVVYLQHCYDSKRYTPAAQVNPQSRTSNLWLTHFQCINLEHQLFRSMVLVLVYMLLYNRESGLESVTMMQRYGLTENIKNRMRERERESKMPAIPSG